MPAKTTSEKPETESNRPAYSMRIGLIKAAIWANKTKDGGTFYSVSFERSFKRSDADDDWGSTQSMNRDDLLVLAKLADAAHSWIVRKEQEK